MAEKKYSAVLTQAGEVALAEAALSGMPVGFALMGVGDGNGMLPAALASQDGLINERYRAPINRLAIADNSANVIRAEMIIPPQVGGFWLREAALYDDDGVCLAVASVPESYKPQLAEGSGRLHALNLWIKVSNTADVKITADLSLVMASVQDVEKAKNEAKDYADKVVGDLDTNIQQAIDNAVKSAVSDAWELDNPVGTTRFFNQNLNPNERWPWSQWVYTGENKTIRIGKADGSNVGQSGGSDNVTIQQANLPAVQVNVSGETSELPGQELTTREAGRHKHKGGMLAPGDVCD
ncbi:phage tail protein, partial [Klebsiella pneumoniae]|uniref:phage tail protein n=1 Tax=Klebsiella pneumoniae TaxID=573 RepID=UPI003B2888DF